MTIAQIPVFHRETKEPRHPSLSLNSFSLVLFHNGPSMDWNDLIVDADRQNWKVRPRPHSLYMYFSWSSGTLSAKQTMIQQNSPQHVSLCLMHPGMQTYIFLQRVHSKQANRARKRKELLFFTVRSLQASQQGTKTQGVIVFYRQITPSKPTGH